MIRDKKVEITFDLLLERNEIVHGPEQMMVLHLFGMEFGLNSLRLGLLAQHSFGIVEITPPSMKEFSVMTNETVLLIAAKGKMGRPGKSGETGTGPAFSITAKNNHSSPLQGLEQSTLGLS